VNFKNVYRITQWGHGEGAQPMPLYVFTVRAETLAEKSEIFRRTPNRREGYQRELQDARLGKGKLGVAGYLLHQMGVFPTSILVNVRSEEGMLKFESKDKITEHIEVGDLEVPDNVTWYVVDGQHRLEGLKIAMREKVELGGYPIIVTMTNGRIFDEMLLFYIVNSRAKSVPTGLAYVILQRMLYDMKAPKWIEQTIMVGADRRKAIAATIVDLLNLDLENPFKGRIQEVGEPRRPEHITKYETLTRYVTLVLKESAFSEMYDRDVAEMLAEYWGAIENMYPRCFEKSQDYLLLSTIGLSSLTRLFPTIYAYCARDGNVSKENMEKYLRCLLESTPEHRDVDFRGPIDEKWWHKVDGPGIVHGTGEGHYTEVAIKFGEKIGLVLKKKRGM
jgi:DGQHR domain-containing protein